MATGKKVIPFANGHKDQSAPGGFVSKRVPYDAVYDVMAIPWLSSRAKVLWALIRRHENQITKVAWPSHDRLLQFLDFKDHDRLRKYLRELRGAGLLVVERRPGRTNRYQTRMPEALREEVRREFYETRPPRETWGGTPPENLGASPPKNLGGNEGKKGGVQERGEITSDEAPGAARAGDSSRGNGIRPSSPPPSGGSSSRSGKGVPQLAASAAEASRTGQPFTQDPKSGEYVYVQDMDNWEDDTARAGRPRVTLGPPDKTERMPTYVPRCVLTSGKGLTPEVAQRLARWPETLGKHPDDGERVKVGSGERGCYVLHEEDGGRGRARFVGIKEDRTNPLELTLDDALKLLERGQPKANGNGRRPMSRHERLSREEHEAYRKQLASTLKPVDG